MIDGRTMPEASDLDPFRKRIVGLSEDFLVRRAAGNGVELIGILAFRASPVWVLAALADASGAGRYLIREIATSLQQEGLLDRTAKFTSVDQMLDGLEASAGRLAGNINTPPLDVATLRQEWAPQNFFKLRDKSSVRAALDRRGTKALYLGKVCQSPPSAL